MRVLPSPCLLRVCLCLTAVGVCQFADAADPDLDSLRDARVATDDAGLVELIEAPVRLVPGSPRNLKVTTPEDLALAEALLRGGRDA